MKSPICRTSNAENLLSALDFGSSRNPVGFADVRIQCVNVQKKY